MREPNIWDVVRLFEDFKNDMKQLLSMMSKNKNALSDVRRDFKRFLNVMEIMTREENMRTFRKFVNELEKFNKNAEEMKEAMKNLEDLVKMFKG